MSGRLVVGGPKVLVAHRDRNSFRLPLLLPRPTPPVLFRRPTFSTNAPGFSTSRLGFFPGVSFLRANQACLP